ncbi:MAG: hypothetical protein A2017_16525 [Lentisphaerae bacterium GWF2_44_16]|nr:MAG: hypothetical protein A2017_16525 [Lentisphaerae bacterium GWF2_44_16]
MQKKILLDSCTYFRLARSIIPLLNIEFGKEKFCLYIIKEFEVEYNKNPRLKNKFDWILEPEHIKERQSIIQVKGKELYDIECAFSFIFSAGRRNGLSPIDAKALAVAYILKIPLVSDDNAVLKEGSKFQIKTMTSLELLKLMVDNNHIKYSKVKEIVSCWAYENELPMGKNKFIVNVAKVVLK